MVLDRSVERFRRRSSNHSRCVCYKANFAMATRSSSARAPTISFRSGAQSASPRPRKRRRWLNGREGTAMAKVVNLIPHTGVHRASRRFLEPAQDLLVLGLGLALFGLMARTLAGLVSEILAPAIDFRGLIAEVLFMLVMVELVRLLVIYLQEHRVA